jgi:hypothetical protein
MDTRALPPDQFLKIAIDLRIEQPVVGRTALNPAGSIGEYLDGCSCR